MAVRALEHGCSVIRANSGSEEPVFGDSNMKTSLKLIIVAALALSIGVAYASPLLIAPNVQPYPRVPEGPKAEFSVNVVYANFNSVDQAGINYNVVLNITNLSNQPAKIYEVAFTAAQDISVKQSILGGTIYDYGALPAEANLPINGWSDFGGIIDGVYLDGKWVNVTWIPTGDVPDGTWQESLLALTQTQWQGSVTSGPLNPDDIAAISANHALNSTIPNLPANASETGIWFEGVPIAEYYDHAGAPLITEMYVNGSWADVTGRVTVDRTQPLMVASNMMLNDVMTVGAQPYQNWFNTTVGPVTGLPNWSGGTGVGRTYSWLFGSGPSEFNNTFAPHESRLIMFNNTQIFGETAPAAISALAALQSGNIKLYASVSNYITNWPVNGTYYNTVSTATQVTQMHLDSTSNGYLYNTILADDQIFQQGTSPIEVTVAPRTQP